MWPWCRCQHSSALRNYVCYVCLQAYAQQPYHASVMGAGYPQQPAGNVMQAGVPRPSVVIPGTTVNPYGALPSPAGILSPASLTSPGSYGLPTYSSAGGLSPAGERELFIVVFSFLKRITLEIKVPVCNTVMGFPGAAVQGVQVHTNLTQMGPFMATVKWRGCAQAFHQKQAAQ